MDDKQNRRLDDEDLAQTPADESVREKRGDAARSYYYDDATGYEIYKEDDDAGEDVDEQDG